MVLALEVASGCSEGVTRHNQTKNGKKSTEHLVGDYPITPKVEVKLRPVPWRCTPLDSLDLVLEGECIATAIVPGAVVYCPLHTNAKKAVVFIRKSLQEKRIHIQGTKMGVWFGAWVCLSDSTKWNMLLERRNVNNFPRMTEKTKYVICFRWVASLETATSAKPMPLISQKHRQLS